MFWLARPPYVRWAIATLVLVTGLVVELLPEATLPHPFATVPVAVGAAVDDSVVEWRDVPAGLFDSVELPLTATRPLAPGDPVLRADPVATDTAGIPADWWGIELPLPLGARPGMRVRVVTDLVVATGVIVESREGDFGERTGLVALPDGPASEVAAAALGGTVAVLIGG